MRTANRAGSTGATRARSATARTPPSAAPKGASRKSAAEPKGTAAQGTSRSRPVSAPDRPVKAAVVAGAGIVWAIVALGAAALDPEAVAVVAAIVGVVASVTWLRAVTPPARRRRAKQKASSQPATRRTVAAVATAVLAPVAALAGAIGPASLAAGVLAAAVVVVVGVGVVVSTVPAQVRRSRMSARVALSVAAPAVAGAATVLAAGQGRTYVLCLVAAVLAYDLGSFVMGNARTALGGPVGLIAGWVCVAVVAVFVAAVMDPPFNGIRPWIVFAAVGVACTGGVVLCNSGTAGARLPAVRRLDSLVLAAPVWVVALAVIGHAGVQ